MALLALRETATLRRKFSTLSQLSISLCHFLRPWSLVFYEPPLVSFVSEDFFHDLSARLSDGGRVDVVMLTMYPTSI